MDVDQPILKLSWPEIRDALHEIEPGFTAIVDELNPEPDCCLYVLSFPYGEMIGDDISQFIPYENGGGFYRLTSEDAPADIIKNLGYGKDSAPLGMVLNKAIEFFVDLPNKELTLPIRVARPGEFYNFSRILSSNSNKKPFAPNGLLKATAGARTVFSLPYLTCNNSFNRLESTIGTLNKYPSSQYDHFDLFKLMTRNQTATSKWRMRLIYFSQKWIDNILNNDKWFKLRSYIYQLAWKASDYKRNQYYYDISYSIMKETSNTGANPYINDTARHLLDIAIGAFPGLAPLINDDLLPLKTIQHVLTYSYGLKKYLPTIIGPEYFDYLAEKPVYYSLQYPITRSFSPKTKNSVSMLQHLDDLKKSMDRFLHLIRNKDSMWYGTILQEAVNNTKFDYIHVNANKNLTPLSPDDVIQNDHRFRVVAEHCVKNNVFPAIDANFFRGCVGLSQK
ncbi:hypothetical protein [Legionella spiritensis]|uniref:hypothetical protein n=1 Tax=Legionella spiritensis TaxID=452 RepID=UPI000F6DEC06|nr:hypothetical protein [Legionella spiritensis]VEG91776.1 Uncharacterised protein [Legionella spiritensis]